MLDDLVRGLTSQEGEAWDNAFVTDITNHLFESGKNSGGLDLVALNIQRGRDHGLAGSVSYALRKVKQAPKPFFKSGYNAYRRICGSGNGEANDWSDLEDLIPRDSVHRLRRFYKNVNDVDLFVGGFLERNVDDSILGPTFKCIVGDQFARLIQHFIYRSFH